MYGEKVFLELEPSLNMPQGFLCGFQYIYSFQTESLRIACLFWWSLVYCRNVRYDNNKILYTHVRIFFARYTRLRIRIISMRVDTFVVGKSIGLSQEKCGIFWLWLFFQ